jgi:hypothetical protein
MIILQKGGEKMKIWIGVAGISYVVGVFSFYKIFSLFPLLRIEKFEQSPLISKGITFSLSLIWPLVAFCGVMVTLFSGLKFVFRSSKVEKR